MKHEWNNEDIIFLADILERSNWLFYGDLDAYFQPFLQDVFAHELRDWGFEKIRVTPAFHLAYWLLISEMVDLNLVEYGTSPRGAWLTRDGERFKRIIQEDDQAIWKANEYTRGKYNSFA